MTIHKLENVIVVVLEAGQTGEHLHRFGGVTCVCVDSDGMAARKPIAALPTSHTYSHITRTLTEEEAAREVDYVSHSEGEGWECYDPIHKYDDTLYHTAVDSFVSKLRSLSPDKAVFVHIDNMKK